MRKTLRHPNIEPPHPGAIILGGLEDSGIKRSELAQALGISRNTLYKLLDGRQGMTAEMAVKISAVWGGSPEQWLGIQADYDLWHARQAVDVSKMRRIAA